MKHARALTIGLSIALVIAVTGSAYAASPMEINVPQEAAAKVRVPNVVGFRMDRATQMLHNARLRVSEECNGLLGCILKSRWVICAQTPRAGKYVNRYSVVVVYGERRGHC